MTGMCPTLFKFWAAANAWSPTRLSSQLLTRLKVRILCFRFSLNPLRFFLTRETDTKIRRSQKLSYLKNFNSWKKKLTKTPILPNCQVPNGYFSINLHAICNCSAFGSSSHFCVSFSRGRKSERVQRNLKHKIRPWSDFQRRTSAWITIFVPGHRSIQYHKRNPRAGKEKL